ncbi:MAG: Uma2 family endonuclease [Planctomycetota bacterium]
MTELLLSQRDASDARVVLRNATWADYQRILELRGESASPRVAYLEGVLELVSPSRRHDYVKSMLGRLIEAWCRETGVEITPYGSWTIESKESERGAEADECYVLGDVEDPERPDLALEVVVSSGGIDKLEIWRKLGVREVWFWQEGALSVHALRGESYVALEASELLPGVDLGLLLRFVDVRPMTRAVREYVAALRAG